MASFIYFYDFTKKYIHAAVRTLFTSETLDLATYQKNREDAEKNIENANHFKWELQCYIQNEPEKEASNLKEAIEVLSHLIQSDLDDIKLIKDTLYAYGSLKDVTEKAKRSIGNLVMKAFHSINRPNEAFEVNTFELICFGIIV